MKTRNITKWLGASVLFGLLSLASQRADAILEMSYTTDSANLIGTAIPGLHTGGGGQAQRDADMANTLLQMSNVANNQQTLSGSLYSRTTWAGGPPATIVGAVLGTGFGDGTTPISIDLSQTGTFNYLVVSYDGPTEGSVAVYNIAGLTGIIQVYRYAKVELDSFGNPTGNLLGSNTMQQDYKRITSWTLLNPTGVPDGGATVMLLGAALGALGMVRRYLIS